MPLLQRLDRASARDRLPRQPRRTKRGRTRGVQAHAQRAIIQALLIALPRDAIVHHAVNEIPSGDRRGQVVGIGVTPGFADLIVISGGRVLFLEVKSQTCRLRKLQEVFRDSVCAQGVRHARAITFQLAKVEVTGPMVNGILAAIRRLGAPPLCP